MKRFVCIPLLIAVFVLPGGSFAQQKNYGTQFSGVVAIPAGRFSDSFKTGFGGVAGMFYDLEPYLRLLLTAGYTAWSVDNEGINKEYRNRGGTGSVDASGHVGAIPLVIGIQLITPGSLRAYGVLEGGLYLYNVHVSGTITDQSGTATIPVDNSFRSEPAFTLGGGALFPLQSTTALDVAARYHFVKDSDVSTSGGSTTIGTSQYFSLSVGINYAFPLPP